MNQVSTPGALIAACDAARAKGQRVGVVPTMGALHDGHLALVDHAKQVADFIIVTIFVNPLQFAEGEDLDAYPRTLERDLELCEARGVDLVFTPEQGALYPRGFSTNVSVGGVSQRLEGEHRPTHFDGVATVVTKLLNMVSPCAGVFGQKDYQQLAVIKRLVADLHIRADVIGAPTVREADGLALSSRNRYLSAEERSRALSISRALRKADALFASGTRDPETLERAGREVLDVDSIDYISLADPLDLSPATPETEAPVMLIAAHIGETRLIDNCVLGGAAPSSDPLD